MDLANLQTEINAFDSAQAIEMEYDLQNQRLMVFGGMDQLNILEKLIIRRIISSISTLPGVEAVAIGNSTLYIADIYFCWIRSKSI